MTTTTLQDVDTAVSVQFYVQIDHESLGYFSTCEGLGVEVVLETREEGGNNRYVEMLPTRLKYSNIKLTRPLGRDTEKVVKWLAEMAGKYQRQTATISAVSAKGQTVAKWELTGVIPVRWTGPSLSADQPKVLTETIEIAHHGFLPGGAG